MSHAFLHYDQRSRVAAILTAVLVFVACFTQPSRAQDALQLWYLERSPYYVTEADGSVSGIVASPVEAAMNAAGIDRQWKQSPGARQLAEVERGTAFACGVGWFRNPKREAFARFSKPVYRDKPMVALIRADDEKTKAHPTLESLMRDKGLAMGAKNGFSYGGFADGMIEALAPKQVVTSQDHKGMGRMLAKRRFDYLLIAAEEADHVLAQLGPLGEQLTTQELSDFPPGNTRYLMCSKAVPQDLIDRFSQALNTP